MQNYFELVRNFQLGDVNAFELLLEEESERILSFVQRYVHLKDIAEDIFQESCIDIWKSREQLKKVESFRSWMYQIVRHRIFKELRRREWRADIIYYDESEELLQLPDRTSNPRYAAELSELAGFLNQEISKLKSKTREMVILRFSSGLNFREISEVLNIPLGTVCYEMSQAMKNIRSGLKAKGVDPKVIFQK